jgi:predicted transposase/invertase (TIGR01784 family)
MMEFTQEEQERNIVRSRKKYQMDMASNLATAEDRGRAEGEARGYAKLIASARNLKALGISEDIIAKSLDLSPEEIAKL